MTMRSISDEVGEPDLMVAGFQLWIHGRQFPDQQDYWDGNWLRVTAHAGASGADVWANGSIVMVSDLEAWANQCDALAKGQIPEAALAPIEPELKVHIRPLDQLGPLTMVVQITPDNLKQQHSFEFEIDQTYLPDIARQCRAIVASYSVRGIAPSKPA